MIGSRRGLHEWMIVRLSLESRLGWPAADPVSPRARVIWKFAWNGNRSLAFMMLASMALASCSQSPDLTRFDGVWTQPPALQGERNAASGIRHVQIFGSSNGPMSFGRIGRGAISRDGILVVSDIATCELVFIHPTSRALLGRLGRCGSGPGEFRAITSLQFYADTLIVFDGGLRQLVFVDSPGREIYRVAVDTTVGLASPSEAYVVDDSTLFVVSSVLLGTGDDAKQPFISLVDRRDGHVVRQALYPPLIGRRNRAPFLNNVAACIAHSADSHRAVVVNQWKFQAVTLGLPHLRNGISLETDLSWVRPIASPISQEGWLPSTGVFSATCAKEHFAVWHAGRMGRHPSMRFPFSHLAIWDYEGNLLFELDQRMLDEIELERVLAVTATRLFLRGTTTEGVPVVAEYAFLPESEGAMAH